MPAKLPSAKKQTVGKAGAALKDKKHSKGKKKHGKGETIEEAPLIIKGGPQGQSYAGGISWMQETILPLNYSYEPLVDRPNLYTLSGGGIAAGFIVINSQGQIIFKFPNDVDEGEYEIKFLP